MIKKIDFVCIGTQKAGTTSLHNILNEHPQIQLPERKEAHFFDKDDRYINGVEWWFNTFFKENDKRKTVGVFTPEYMYFEEVPARIYKTLGSDVKLIVVLRQPVKRAYSHYLMSYGRGIERLTFDQAIKSENERLTVGSYYNRNHFSYFSRSYYSVQLERYFRLFKKENIKIYIFEEDIVDNLERTLIDIQQFIGVEKISLNSTVKSNPASDARFKFIRRVFFDKQSPIRKIASKLPLAEGVKFKLASLIDRLNRKPSSAKKLTSEEVCNLTKSHFNDEIEKLELLLERDLSIWK